MAILDARTITTNLIESSKKFAITGVSSVADLQVAGQQELQLATAASLWLLMISVGISLATISALVSHIVVMKDSEMAIRIAVGATSYQVRLAVIRHVFAPLLVGGLAGLGLALLAGRVVRYLQFEAVTVGLPTVAIGVALTLFLALVAALAAANRVTRIAVSTTLQRGAA